MLTARAIEVGERRAYRPDEEALLGKDVELELACWTERRGWSYLSKVLEDVVAVGTVRAWVGWEGSCDMLGDGSATGLEDGP